MRRNAALSIAIGIATISGLGTAFAFAGLIGFDSAPGLTLAQPLQWPKQSRIVQRPGRPELLVFTHPLCGCTRATIAELGKLRELQRTGPATPEVLFVVSRPPGSGWVWDASRQTSALPESRWMWDEAGVEAKRFGAATSGLVLLYGARGGLIFHGGVTGSRGHEGGNDGSDQLQTALANAFGDGVALYPVRAGPPFAGQVFSSRVFGCSLRL